ncbi:MAG TPA: DNA ligase [Noviherbaspirillum sp.]|nr:DNA ligase [Noviherbaspirillum sp.]
MESRVYIQIRCLFALLLVASTFGFLPLAVAGSTNDAGEAPAAVLLAQDFSTTVDPGAYWVSEKLDGVRALWDGETLRFRSGRTIHAPAWFTADFPAHPLDGELWMGRRQFDRISAAVRRQVPLDAEWRMIRYQIFEWPGAAGTFSQRLDALDASIARTNVPWLRLVKQFRIADRQALKAKLDQVVRDGGEGLMLHRADALWQTGRTGALLKLKPQHDAEAIVIAHLPGKGKYQGLCGALLVETSNGQRFRLGAGLTDAQRRSPPPIGSVVTYRYRERTPNGLPRFASFLRIRNDE